MLAGNVTALLSPVLFVPLFTFTFGQQKYDWKSMQAIRRGDDSDLAKAAHVDLELVPGETNRSEDLMAEEQHKLKRSAFIARSLTVFLTLALVILWPWPMYGSAYIFSKKFFTGWVVVGILWLFFSTFFVGIWPVVEGRNTIVHTIKSMYLDVRGRYDPARAHHHEGQEGVVVVGEEKEKKDPSPGEVTPTDGEKGEKVVSPTEKEE